MNTKTEQYSLGKIISIWLIAGAPMWILGWVAYPAMSNGLFPVDAGLLRIKFLTLGLVWQFILSMLILYREEGNIRFETIRRRFWLNHPISPKTSTVQKNLWWWIIPLIVLVALLELGLNSVLTDVWLKVFPFFAEPEGYSFDSVFTPETRVQFVGNWGLLGLFVALAIFNTFLGEEFVFRGVLLPKMEGVFGKWDWAANGILFSFYHLHQPWGIFGGLPADLVFAYTGKRFRSNWFPIILHSGQSVFFLILILGIVLGLG
jgi:uncharacterized protein